MRILVAFDGSDAAERALRVAAELAQRCGARLVIGHVLPTGDDALPEYEPFESYLAEQGGSLLRRALLSSGVPPERLETRLERGDAADVLARLAVDVDAFLVVVGSRGLGAIGRVVLGSVSDKVLRTCDRPVLVVH